MLICMGICRGQAFPDGKKHSRTCCPWYVKLTDEWTH